MSENRGSGIPNPEDRSSWNSGLRGHSDWFRNQINPAVARKKVTEKAEPNKEISFEIDVVTIADQISRLVIKKQQDYGPNNIQRSPFGPLHGLIVRMYDKVARAANLTSKPYRTPSNEPLRDSFLDLAGYAILAILVLDKRFPEAE